MERLIKLNFYEPLHTLILSGEKTFIWRIDDDKDISYGDKFYV